MASLKPVDKLTLTIVVDNVIDRMSPLPPGFIHEGPQHVRDPKNETEPNTGIPIVDFNRFCCGAHGLAILIETNISGRTPHTVLLDTGPDRRTILHNMESLHINPGSIERVVISHWHSDHTGGLLSFLEDRRRSITSSVDGDADQVDPIVPCVVDVHPDRPELRGIAPGPSFDKPLVAIPRDPGFDEITSLGASIEKHDKEHAVADDTVWISGEIPRITEYEQGIKGGIRLIDQQWVAEEHIMDERYVAVDVAGKGLVLFSSCSHAGIVNVVKDAIAKHQRPVYMIIGGLHLAGAEYASRIPLTVEFLSSQMRPCPTYIVPLHCTGFPAKVALEKAFGEGCVPGGTGHKINIIGDRSFEDRIGGATY